MHNFMNPSEIIVFDIKKNSSKNILIRIFSPFRNFTKNEKWKILDNILNSRCEKPNYLILYNIMWFRHCYPRQSELLDEEIKKYNEINNPEKYAIYDFCKDFNFDCVSDLFKNEPGSYGWRGDVELWQDLKENSKEIKLPKTESELVEILKNLIIKLTGNSVYETEDFFVDKYYHGSGMSGGIVNSNWWISKGIPLIIARFKIKNCA